MMQIAIPLFPGFTALDAIGPYEVLSRVPGAHVGFVAAQPGVVRTDTGQPAIVVDAALSDMPAPDVIVVPGGFGTRRIVAEPEAPLTRWVAAVHPTTAYTTSVCTGSLVLGAAGVLRGLEATTHWNVLDRLADYGAVPVSRRVVVQGKIITAAGVSAGIDMALTLAAALAGPDVARLIQLAIEYDPEPPFDCGSPAKAGPDLVAVARAVVNRLEVDAAAPGAA
jgi:putative intracellular protease/amidase